MSVIREPAVAGQFYPGTADELSTVVQGFLDETAVPDGPTPKAMIAPHAGYVYSGPIAASAYTHLRPAHDTITRVVLLGPCHRVAVQGLALSGADAFRTPLGDVTVDQDAAAAIADLPQVQVFDATHELEHSLEVHLPFLQVVLDAFSVVPLVVGEAAPESVAEVLEALWGGPETLIVVSSDLSHYLDYDAAQKLDGETCRAIEELDPGAIAREGACGRFPVGGLLAVAKRRGMSVQTLDVRNSGDTAGLRDQVVGYGSWIFLEKQPKPRAKVTWGETIVKPKPAEPEAEELAEPETEELAEPGSAVEVEPEPETAAEPEAASKPAVAESAADVDEGDFAAATRTLLKEHGTTLILLAAASIDHGLAHGETLPINQSEHAEDLQNDGACFVTLKRDGKLRGCIGSPEAHRPLIEDVADNAFRSAFKDPRFPALTGTERDGLEMSISVLSPKTPISFAGEDDLLSQLRPGVDGLVIEDNGLRALFLPSVWAQLTEPAEFLARLKVKSGMKEDHWSDGFKAWRFVAEEIAATDLMNET